MRKVTLIGSITVLLVAILSIVSAFNFGEPTAFYARGNITIKPELLEKAEYAKTLYLVVFKQGSPMPFGAMKQRLEGRLTGEPIPFNISKERLQLMNEHDQYGPGPKVIRIKARLDLDGIAGPDQPGDLTGQLVNVARGSTAIEIAINNYVSDQ